MLTLHIPRGEVAVGEDDAAFPHTPRLAPLWFDAEPAAELIEQCLRRGTCAGTESEREWLAQKLTLLGHSANDAGQHLMAHSWFECAYAARGSMTELLSSANMRFKLGQWHLVKQLYAHVCTVELTEAQRAMAQRKSAEVNDLLTSGTTPPRISPAEEHRQLLDAPRTVASLLPEADAMAVHKMLRASGHAANRARDFEAAQAWFDCAWALSAALADLLSSANMRLKLEPASAVAAAAYGHVLSLSAAQEGPTEKELAMARQRLEHVQSQQQQQERAESISEAADASVSYGKNVD